MTGGAQDLGLAQHQTQHLERLQPRIHAGDDRDASVRVAVEAARSGGGVTPVGVQKIIELLGHGG